jgi:general stress protein 26
MPRGENEPNDVDVSRLLAGAAKMIAGVRYCWLLTESETSGVNTRPMGQLLPDSDHNDWIIRFIADGRSRKASDIRRTNNVELIFQHNNDEAFAAFAGRATLIEDPSDVARLWKGAYRSHFPSETDRLNAAFIEIFVERMELWIRGVTPQPFGYQPTILERQAGGRWLLVPKASSH